MNILEDPEFIEFRGVLANEEAKCNWEIHREEESQCYINRKVPACSHYQLCPGILVEHLSSLLTSTLQGNIPVNCDYPAASYCMYM